MLLVFLSIIAVSLLFRSVASGNQEGGAKRRRKVTAEADDADPYRDIRFWKIIDFLRGFWFTR